MSPTARAMGHAAYALSRNSTGGPYVSGIPVDRDAASNNAIGMSVFPIAWQLRPTCGIRVCWRP
jgi:hypothetical protein